MYKLPKMGGEVIRAMPERKHSFFQKVFPKLQIFSNKNKHYSTMLILGDATASNNVITHTRPIPCTVQWRVASQQTTACLLCFKVKWYSQKGQLFIDLGVSVGDGQWVSSNIFKWERGLPDKGWTRYNASKVELKASCSLGRLGSKIHVEDVDLEVTMNHWW